MAQTKGVKRRDTGFKTGVKWVFITVWSIIFILTSPMMPHIREIPLNIYSFAIQEEKLSIDDVSLTEKRGKLHLSFALKNGFTFPITQTIQSGIPVKFTYEIIILKKGFFWNSEIVNLKLTRTVTYHNIRNSYLISENYPSLKVINFNTMEEAKRYITHLSDLPLIPLASLDKDTSYTLKLKASVMKQGKKMPFYGLMKVFTSFEMETDWYVLKFSY